MTKKELSRLNRCVRGVVYIYLISFAVVFVLLQKRKGELGIDKYESVQDYMIMNYKKGLLTHIEPKENCVPPLEVELIDVWPGTVNGCFCKKTGVLTKGRCAGNRYMDECEDVESVEKKPMVYWGKTKICTKTTRNFTFVRNN